MDNRMWNYFNVYVQMRELVKKNKKKTDRQHNSEVETACQKCF